MVQLRKATEKLVNQISNFEEIEYEKPLNITQLELKGNLMKKST